MKNKIKITQAELDALRQQHHDQSSRIDELKRLASRTAFQLDDVHERIERSKPIYERLLGKVRKRDQQYRTEIESLTTKADKSMKLASELMKRHEQGIALMSRHGLLEKYTEPNTNFTDRQQPAAIPPEVREFIPQAVEPRPKTGTSNRTKIYSQRREQNEEDLKPMKSPDPIKPESLYELLQKKLKAGNRPPLPSSKAPESTLRNRINQVSEELKRQANHLREMRRSLSRGPNTTSETRIRPAPRPRQETEQASAPLPKSASVRFIQSKQRRLDNLRQNISGKAKLA